MCRGGGYEAQMLHFQNRLRGLWIVGTPTFNTHLTISYHQFYDLWLISLCHGFSSCNMMTEIRFNCYVSHVWSVKKVSVCCVVNRLLSFSPAAGWSRLLIMADCSRSVEEIKSLMKSCRGSNPQQVAAHFDRWAPTYEQVSDRNWQRPDRTTTEQLGPECRTHVTCRLENMTWVGLDPRLLVQPEPSDKLWNGKDESDPGLYSGQQYMTHSTSGFTLKINFV